MILTRDEILKEIKNERIKIKPFRKKSLGPASYDMSIGNEFRTFIKTGKNLLIDEHADYKKITKIVRTTKPFILESGESALGITNEELTLPDNICGWIQGRSRFARLGLMVHITAAFIQPGVKNRQVLEFFNAHPESVAIKPGTRVCTVIFETCKGNARYKGKFLNQKL
ncbi:MAG: dCTP deaminase [Candidatus Aenigmatarchaeota archaeon]